MIFMLLVIFILSGFTLSALSIVAIPISIMFGVLLLFMGLIIQFVGVIIIYTRAAKTGLQHLLDFSRPDKVIWLFVRHDDTILIAPALRNIEGFESSKQLKDGIIKHVKSYRLSDHNVRIVKEGMHFSTNLDMCLYAKYLKNIGIKNIFQANKLKEGNMEFRK